MAGREEIDHTRDLVVSSNVVRKDSKHEIQGQNQIPVELEGIKLDFAFPDGISSGYTFLYGDEQVQVIKLMGAGSISQVYLAEVADKRVVLKLVQPPIFKQLRADLKSQNQRKKTLAIQLESEVLTRLNAAEVSDFAAAVTLLDRIKIAEQTRDNRHIVALLGHGTDQEGAAFALQELAPENLVQLSKEGTIEYEVQILTIMAQVADAITLSHQHGLSLNDFGLSKENRVRVDYSDPDYPHAMIIDWNVTGGVSNLEFKPQSDWIKFGYHLYHMLLPGERNPLNLNLVGNDFSEKTFDFLPENISQIEEREEQWKQLTWMSKKILRRLLTRNSLEEIANTSTELFKDIEYLRISAITFRKNPEIATRMLKSSAIRNLELGDFQHALIDADLGLRVAPDLDSVNYFLTVVDAVSDPEYSPDELPTDVVSKIQAARKVSAVVTTKISADMMNIYMVDRGDTISSQGHLASGEPGSELPDKGDRDSKKVRQEFSAVKEHTQKVLCAVQSQLIRSWLENPAQPGVVKDEASPFFTSQEYSALETLGHDISDNRKTFDTIDVSIVSEIGKPLLFALIKLGNEAAEQISQYVDRLNGREVSQSVEVHWIKQELVRLCVTQLQAYRVALRILDNSNQQGMPKLRTIAVQLQQSLALGEANVRELLTEASEDVSKPEQDTLLLPNSQPSEVAPNDVKALIIHPVKGGPDFRKDTPADPLQNSPYPNQSLKDLLKASRRDTVSADPSGENLQGQAATSRYKESERWKITEQIRNQLCQALGELKDKDSGAVEPLSEQNLKEIIHLFERLNMHDTPSRNEINKYYPALGRALGCIISAYKVVDENLNPADFLPSNDPEDVSSLISALISSILSNFGQNALLGKMKRAGEVGINDRGRSGQRVDSDDYIDVSWLKAEKQWQHLKELTGIDIDIFLTLLAQVDNYLSIMDTLSPAILHNIKIVL